MKVGGEPLQQEFNRGYDFLLNTYGAAENIIPSLNYQTLLVKGIVIDIDFNITKNYKRAAQEPPFIIYAKIIGEDLDVDHPELQVEKIFYSSFLPIHNLSIPEIGEEILIMRESSDPSSKGYYIGRVDNASTLNYYPARQYMDSEREGITPGPFKYGFSFDIDEIRNKKIDESPSSRDQSFSIPITFGDVVQQGRSQSYVRHSFNRSNKKGVLEQGLRVGQESTFMLGGNVDPAAMGNDQQNPSIGETATKTIHFVDSSIMKLGNYSLASTLPGDLNQKNIDGEDKSMIVNISDEIYNIARKSSEPSLYRQVLGERLVTQQKETNSLIKNMLTEIGELTKIVQYTIEALKDHNHEYSTETIDRVRTSSTRGLDEKMTNISDDHTNNLITSFDKKKERVDNLISTAENILSKSQFIN